MKLHNSRLALGYRDYRREKVSVLEIIANSASA